MVGHGRGRGRGLGAPGVADGSDEEDAPQPPKLYPVSWCVGSGRGFKSLVRTA